MDHLKAHIAEWEAGEEARLRAERRSGRGIKRPRDEEEAEAAEYEPQVIEPAFEFARWKGTV